MNDLSPDSRAILEAAGDPDGPSPAARTRMKRALATHAAILAGVGATTAAGAVGAVNGVSAGTGILAIKWLSAVVLVGAAAGTAVWGVRAAHRESAVAVTPVHLIVPSPIQLSTPDTVVPPPSESAPPSVDPTPTSIVSPGNFPLHHTRAHNAPAGPQTAQDPTPVDTLANELSDIRSAQAALQRGDASAALHALSHHATRFPDGTLREERRGLRVAALCALGRIADARAEAQRLLAENPQSPQAGRLRASCVGNPR